jgi:hypothetical protein
MAFGNVNGLGVTSVAAPPAVITTGVTGGVLYTSAYNLDVTLSGSAKTNDVDITAQVTTNFTHFAVLGVKNCQPAGTCSTAAGFTTIPTAGTINVIPTTLVGTSQPFTPTIAILVSNTNGASAYVGTDQVTITFRATAAGFSATATLTLTLSVQNAVQLTLGTAPGGLTISPATDFSVNFGNVNALGVGTPLAGLTKTAAVNATIYSTPYLIQPVFSGFVSATTGTIEFHVSPNFAKSTILELDDASSCCAAGSFTALPTPTAGTAQITSVSSGSIITRYLGLRVTKANGAGSTGSDNATVVFTLTVP